MLNHSFLGGSLGAGLRVHATGALSLGLEGRWHTNLSAGPYMAPNESRRLSLLSITGGATLSWWRGASGTVSKASHKDVTACLVGLTVADMPSR